MPRYTYEIEFVPDATEDEQPVGGKTTARFLKSVMVSSIELQNEAQLHAHMRSQMKRSGNWKTQFREAGQNGSVNPPAAMKEGLRVKIGKDGEEVPQ